VCDRLTDSLKTTREKDGEIRQGKDEEIRQGKMTVLKRKAFIQINSAMVTPFACQLKRVLCVKLSLH
jgi:hypothetical protein